jgi:putative tricarboxylic transport membrane protein
VAIGGVSEFIGQLKSGDVTAVGVLCENPLPGVDAPTARQQGLDVTLSNWRGLYGPPDMPKSAVDYWQKALGEMVQSPTWKEIAQRSQFTTAFMTSCRASWRRPRRTSRRPSRRRPNDRRMRSGQ